MNTMVHDNTSCVHPQKIMVMNRGDYTSCTLNLHGATLTSWRIKNKEMLFLSRESHFTGLSHIRGGIQFAFPVIGPWLFGPRQGFARDMFWTLEDGPKKLDTGDVYAMVSLADNAYTHSVWNYRFKLYYQIYLCEYKVIFHIGVENCSMVYPFEFYIIQHSQLRVSDINKSEIIGLKGCKYRNNLEDDGIVTEEREKVTFEEHTDKDYIDAPNEVTITNTMNGGKMKITKKGTKDFTLWSPWIKMSLKIPDLGNDEYKHFVAVEPGIIMKPLRIEPQTCWDAQQIFEFIEPKKEKIVDDFYDLFDGYC